MYLTRSWGTSATRLRGTGCVGGIMRMSKIMMISAIRKSVPYALSRLHSQHEEYYRRYACTLYSSPLRRVRSTITLPDGKKVIIRPFSLDDSIITEQYGEQETYLRPEPNSVVLDIGAHIGIFTVKVSSIPGITVHAFEPFPRNYALLKQNVLLNKLQNVLLYDCAIGGRCGTASLNYDNGSTVSASIVRKESKGIPVMMKTIDSLGLARIDFIKLDVERAEYDALLGGLETIGTQYPVISMEVHGKENPRLCTNLLESLGYTVNHRGRYLHAKVK